MEVAEKFRDHINSVLSATITTTPVQPLPTKGGVQLAFRNPNGNPAEVPLATRVGVMQFYFGHTCLSEVNRDGIHRLHTRSYNYLLTPASTRVPILRWEYHRTPPTGALWCRHHLQGPITIKLNNQDNVLDNLHLPTGYVTFEEIIRFLIDDLQVSAPPDWDNTLRESHRKFTQDFVR